MNTSLTTSETSTIIQAKILGLMVPQVVVTDRLRALGVPGYLIDAAVVTASNEAEEEQAENAIISWYSAQHDLSKDTALRVLNGQTTLEQE